MTLPSLPRFRNRNAPEAPNFHKEPEFESVAKLDLKYGDTRRNGDPGVAVMQWGNTDTAKALARAIRMSYAYKGGYYEGIAAELDRKAEGRAPAAPADPEFQQSAPNTLEMQTAIAARDFIARAAMGDLEGQGLDDEAKAVVEVLDERLPALNHVPEDIDEEFAQLVEREGLTEKIMRESVERQPIDSQS